MEILPTVLAHTGNDAIDHSFTIIDGMIGIIILLILILISFWLIKKRQKRIKKERGR